MAGFKDKVAAEGKRNTQDKTGQGKEGEKKQPSCHHAQPALVREALNPGQKTGEEDDQ